jgi:hypothetical protein
MNIFTTKNIIIFLVFVTIGVTVFFIIKNKNKKSDEDILDNAAKLAGFKKEGTENFVNLNENILFNPKGQGEKIYETYFSYFNRQDFKNKFIEFMNHDMHKDLEDLLHIIYENIYIYSMISNNIPDIEKEKMMIMHVATNLAKSKKLDMDIIYKIVKNKMHIYNVEKDKKCNELKDGKYCNKDGTDYNCIKVLEVPNSCVVIKSNELSKLFKDYIENKNEYEKQIQDQSTDPDDIPDPKFSLVDFNENTSLDEFYDLIINAINLIYKNKGYA